MNTHTHNQDVERRQQTRIRTGDLSGRLGGGISVQVTELSLEGISLETRSALRPGGYYTLRLLESRGEEIEARVIWCRLDRNKPGTNGESVAVFRAGLSQA
jgi:hypothetical protein